MPSTHIGPYEIERRLGAGGMAEVFLARKPLGAAFKRVVIKRILPALASDDRFVEMFLREASVLAQLNHPNIVQIFDLGTTEAGEPYIAMEFLEGLSAYEIGSRARRARIPLPTKLVVRIILEAARGLEYIHRHTVVHRDISPDNILHLNEGVVKLVDFGIARSASTKELTFKGELKGKLRFMAPEILEDKDMDGRADLWSLGVSAYWLLGNRYPFRGKNELDLIRHIVREQPPRIASVRADVPPWLDDLVDRLLTKNRDDRIPSGAEVERIIAKNAAHDIDRSTDVSFVADIVRVGQKLDEIAAATKARRNPLFSSSSSQLTSSEKSIPSASGVFDDPTIKAPVTFSGVDERLSDDTSSIEGRAPLSGQAVSDEFSGDTDVVPFIESAPPAKLKDVSANKTLSTPGEEPSTTYTAPIPSSTDLPVLGDTDIKAIPSSSELASFAGDAPFDGDTDVAPAKNADPFATMPTTVERREAALPRPLPNPLPRALNVALPSEEGDDNTQRLTESQMGLKRPDDDRE